MQMVDFHIDVSSDQSDNVVEHDIVAWLYSRMKPGKNHTTAYHLEKARAQIAFSKPSFPGMFFFISGGCFIMFAPWKPWGKLHPRLKVIFCGFYHGIHHRFSPPFVRKFFGTVSKHQTSTSKKIAWSTMFVSFVLLFPKCHGFKRRKQKLLHLRAIYHKVSRLQQIGVKSKVTFTDPSLPNTS